MNVLLLYPEFPDTFWSFKHALKFIRKRASLPPLGLLTVGAMLPESWGKRLVDLNVQRLRRKDIAWADCAFVSAMAVQRDAARNLIVRCKEAGLTVVAGGPLFICEHEQFPEVDHFVLNEAEVTLPRFLADLELGRPDRVYSTSEFPDVRRTPAPLWELAKKNRYATMSLQYSRGCPYNCEFCNVTAMFGHKPRTKTAAQVIDELDLLHDRGWRGAVFFVDDNFIGDRRRLKTELLPALIEWQKRKGGMAFSTEVSINLADDDELMEMMWHAGFDSVFIGIETPDEESLAECSKNQNRKRDLIEDVKRIQRAGLQVQGGFILGFDNDAPSIFERQIAFIQQSGIVTAMVGLLEAIPGTRLFERLKGEGRLAGQTTGNNMDGLTNIVPKMNLETLRDGYKNILRHIYAPRHYYARIKTLLKEYRPPRVQPPLRIGNLKAFARSIVQLGIVGPERFHYWRLLIWTFFRRRKSFSVAVTLSIYGYHFRRTCEQHAPSSE